MVLTLRTRWRVVAGLPGGDGALFDALTKGSDAISDAISFEAFITWALSRTLRQTEDDVALVQLLQPLEGLLLLGSELAAAGRRREQRLARVLRQPLERLAEW